MNEKAEKKITVFVIQSSMNRRFTYEEAQNIIETGEGDYNKEIIRISLVQILQKSMNGCRCH